MVDGKGAQRLCFAAKFRDRLMGLFSRRSSDEILLIVPCHSVHTFGMGYAIDVAFVGREGRVLESYKNVPPWRLKKTSWCLCGFRAKGVRERFERVLG